MSDLPSLIKAVIRDPHGKVNRLNTARIPFCLPPKASSPALFALGLSYYAEIYFGLEKVWLSNVCNYSKSMSVISDNPASYDNDKARVQAVLCLVYLPELLRTARLRADFSALVAVAPGAIDLDGAQIHAGIEFRNYIEEHISAEPHRLVAYIWIMYQALFNGGRFIRSQILKAGTEFWGLGGDATLDPAALPPPLSFSSVEDSDLAQEQLRSRLIQADKLLTVVERQNILDEALKIFQRCELLTLHLDKAVQGLRACHDLGTV